MRGCAGHWIYGRASLLAQAEALDQRAVGLDVLALEVVEQAAALAHHGEQPAARMEILDVRLEMLGEHVDPLGEERDLNFGRTRVALGALVMGNDARLVCCGHGHLNKSPGLVKPVSVVSIEPSILAGKGAQTQEKSGDSAPVSAIRRRGAMDPGVARIPTPRKRPPGSKTANSPPSASPAERIGRPCTKSSVSCGVAAQRPRPPPPAPAGRARRPPPPPSRSAAAPSSGPAREQ